MARDGASRWKPRQIPDGGSEMGPFACTRWYLQADYDAGRQENGPVLFKDTYVRATLPLQVMPSVQLRPTISTFWHNQYSIDIVLAN